MPAFDPLPDPVAHARALSDDELRAYKEIYGEGSREWIIARPLRSCWGSALLAALLVALFLVELGRGAVGNDARLLALGALPDSGGLHQGYWRLVAFGFLHSNLTHLLLNLLLLLLAGPAVERRIGTGWMLSTFLAASVASGIAILVKHDFWPSSGASVGASGGLFGLLAAALLLVYRLDRHNRLGRAVLTAALVLGLAYSLVPGISLAGHAAGLAAGASLGLVARAVIKARPASRRPS
jgi:membrane associated rhomboid family serine protease